jgi:uncharacterized protein YdhG (YjbR/CyaY superfamily)
LNTEDTAPRNIDEYFAAFPSDVQDILQKVRTTIREAAPEAQETISYQIPTFTLKGKYLICFAGYKKHISLYSAPIGLDEFKTELAPYESGKGTAKFPLDKPIPLDVISRIVKYRVTANLGREAAKPDPA